VKVALLAAAAIVLTATPATAGPAGDATATPGPDGHAVVLKDGPGDVWTFSDSTSGYELAAQPAADVLRARITHGAYAVSVRMVFDDLQRGNIQLYYCDIHTPGVTSWFILEVKDRGRGTFFQDVKGEWVRVPGVTHHIDYASDVVTMRFPRTLLGGPPWVRVRLHNVLGLPDGTFFTDNPLTADQNAAFTPRLPPPVDG
jgi:hypothetical protein